MSLDLRSYYQAWYKISVVLHDCIWYILLTTCFQRGVVLAFGYSYLVVDAAMGICCVVLQLERNHHIYKTDEKS